MATDARHFPQIEARGLTLASAVIAVLFVALAMDQTMDQSIRTRFWQDLPLLPPLLAVRNASPAVAMACIVVISALALHHRFRIPTGPEAYGAVALYAIASLRMAFSGDVGATDYAVSGAACFALLSFIATYAARYGPSFHQAILHALLVAAYALIAANVVNLAFGNGFVAGNPRLFGTSGHPNFIAVQIALCVLWISASRPVGWRAAARWLAMAAGAYLIVLSGSRTGFVVLGSGLAALVLARARSVSRALLMLALVLLTVWAALFAISASPDVAQVLQTFNRAGGADTRSEAWGALWSAISAEPVNGLGSFIAQTENSLLKGWAAFGIVYAVLFVAVAVLVLTRLWRLSRRNRKSRAHFSAYFAVAAAMQMGSVFEGYLVENFSFTTALWILLVGISDSSRRAASAALPASAARAI